MLQISEKKNRVSALSSVERSGLELVRKRKCRGKLATMRDYAKINFEPWTRSPDMHPDELIPADETLHNCGIPARMAYATMLQTREHLVGMFDKIELDHIDSMLASFVDSAETLKAIASMLEAAYLRVLVAGCANQIEKGKALGLQKRRRTLRKRQRN